MCDVCITKNVLVKICNSVIISNRYIFLHRSTGFTQAERETHFVNKDKVKFNFDEFYRMHYGAALQRQRADKKKRKEDALNATMYSTPKSVQQMLMMGTTLSIFVIGLYLFPTTKNLPM